MQLLLLWYLSGSGLTDRIHGSPISQKFGNMKPRLRGQSCVRTRDESWNVIRHSFTFAPTRFSWCWIRCKRKLMLESQIRSSRVRKLSRFSCDYNPIWMLCQQWDNVPIRIQFKLKSRRQLFLRTHIETGWNKGSRKRYTVFTNSESFYCLVDRYECRKRLSNRENSSPEVNCDF